MVLFYFNDTIEKYERESDFLNVIKELEKEILFDIKKYFVEENEIIITGETICL